MDDDLLRWQDDGGQWVDDTDPEPVWYLTYPELRRMF